MKKDEIIERIIFAIKGMGSDRPEDTAWAGYLNLDDAKKYLAESKAEEAKNVPACDMLLTNDVTPELYMEAYNCYVRKCRFDVTKERLTDWLVNECKWDVYEWYCNTALKSVPTVIYTDWLTEEIEWPFEDEGEINMLGMVTVGINSKDTFNPEETFCWYNSEKKQLFSDNNPFKCGAIDREQIVEYILSNYDNIDTVQTCFMDNTDIDYIFRYWGDK